MASINRWEILVVDDEPDAQLVVAGILNHFEVVVDIVGTAEEALAALDVKHYSGAIIDLALPGMDGLSLVRTIRENTNMAFLPCIAITAYHTSVVKQQAIDSGFNSYLSKPIDNALLVRELSRIIQ